MTDIRKQLHEFLKSKTDWAVINAMQQFTEPEKYISYYILNADTETIDRGTRKYNEATDKVEISHAPIPLSTIQLDIRGTGSFTEATRLFFSFQWWQNDLKAFDLYYRGVGQIVPIPRLQNAYVKEGYQFNIFLSYDSALTVEVDYAEKLKLINKEI